MAIFTLESIAMELCFTFYWSLFSPEELLMEFGDEVPGMEIQERAWADEAGNSKRRWRAVARRAAIIAKTEQDITLTDPHGSDALMAEQALMGCAGVRKHLRGLGAFMFREVNPDVDWGRCGQEERDRWDRIGAEVSKQVVIKIQTENFISVHDNAELLKDEKGFHIILKVTEDCGDIGCPDGFFFDGAKWNGYQLLMHFRENTDTEYRHVKV